MYVYPQVPISYAHEVASLHGHESIEQLKKCSAFQIDDQTYSPTGGVRAPNEHLASLQRIVREIAERAGYPEYPSRDSSRDFDAGCARSLCDQMRVTASEASKGGVWRFVSSVLLPDVVRWRFRGMGAKITHEARFQGGVRNAFQRLWWRAYILADPKSENRYHLLESLNEDELVQVMERPQIAGHSTLMRVVCDEFLRSVGAAQASKRMQLMRDIQRRLMRLSSIVAFELLSDSDYAALATTVVRESMNSLEKPEAAMAAEGDVGDADESESAGEDDEEDSEGNGRDEEGEVPLIDPRYAPPQVLAVKLAEVLREKGTLRREVALKELSRALGLARYTRRQEARFRGVVISGLRQGLIDQQKRGRQRWLRAKDTDEDSEPQIDGKKIRDIPPDEIVRLFEAIVIEAGVLGEVDQEFMYRAVVDRLGLRRLTHTRRKALDHAWRVWEETRE